MPSPIALRPAGPGDAQAIWEWRNEPAARAASFSSQEIPWEAHARWYAERLGDPALRLLVVADAASGEEAGYVRFAVHRDTAEISVALGAAARGRGTGRAAIAGGSAWLFAEVPAVRRIVARIKPSNEASLRAFRAAGFVDTAAGDADAVVLELVRPAP